MHDTASYKTIIHDGLLVQHGLQGLNTIVDARRNELSGLGGDLGVSSLAEAILNSPKTGCGIAYKQRGVRY